MKALMMLVLVWVWARRGEAVTCENVISCTPDTSMMASSRGADIAAVCKSVQEAIHCFREAMQDCRRTQSIPESTINTLEAQIDGYDDMLKEHCGRPVSNRHDYGNRVRGPEVSDGVSDVRSSVIVLFVVILLGVIFL